MAMVVRDIGGGEGEVVCRGRGESQRGICVCAGCLESWWWWRWWGMAGQMFSWVLGSNRRSRDPVRVRQGLE